MFQAEWEEAEVIMEESILARSSILSVSKRQYSVPNCPQQNGVAERRNTTKVEKQA